MIVSEGAISKSGKNEQLNLSQGFHRETDTQTPKEAEAQAQTDTQTVPESPASRFARWRLPSCIDGVQTLWTPAIKPNFDPPPPPEVRLH